MLHFPIGKEKSSSPFLPIQNSEFKILSLSHLSHLSHLSQPSQPSHTSQPPHTCIVLIASILNSPSPLIHYTFSVSLAQPAFLAFSLSRGVKPFFVFLIGIKDKMVTSSSGSSSSSSSWVLFQVTSLT